MAFGFTRNRLSPIAIDPGADQLKLLQVAGSDPGALVAMAAEAVPESARSDNESRQQFLAEALPRLIQEAGFRGRRAMCTIPAFQTFVHHLDIAAHEKISQQDQIEAQLRERFNVEPTRMVVRSFDVGAIQRESGQVRRVVCLAARRELVMQYVELARRCRLEVVGMHSEPLCTARAFSTLNRRADDQQRAWCYIDLGAATTKVTLAAGQEMIFTKTIQAGGNETVRAKAKARSISFDQARTAHVTEAATAAQGGERVSSIDTPPAATAVAAPENPADAEGFAFSQGPDTEDADHEAFDTIVDELHLCLRYHRRVMPEKPIEKLVFLGGEAQRRDRCIAIAQRLGLPAQMGSPLARFAISDEAAMIGGDPGEPQPGWAVPAGLCFSEANW